MSVAPSEIRARLKRFEETCRQAGVKLTHQRREIFREVASSEEHPDAESVYERVRTRIPEISLDTVYRTLRRLRELGLLTVLGSSPERMRVDANPRPHHHFCCVVCGFTRDFYCSSLDELPIPLSVADYGLIQSSQVEVRGICHGCSKSSNP